jgi:hypothetical protein
MRCGGGCNTSQSPTTAKSTPWSRAASAAGKSPAKVARRMSVAKKNKELFDEAGGNMERRFKMNTETR